jgi:hypothetical protein
MDTVALPLTLYLVVAGSLAAATFIALILGWPWIKRAWWARKARSIRGRATSRVERFTATPADAAELSSTTPMPGGGAPRQIWRPAMIREETGRPAWEDSSRLRRLAEHVAEQEEMVARVAGELDEEADPLRQLVDRQARTMDRVMANLGQQLEPVRAFAAGEESNLRALQERIEGDGMRFVAHSFARVLEEQRDRTEATFEQIERQREPFEQFAADELETIEHALKRFDADVAALEQASTEQRKVALRLLDAMRSDEFKEVKSFLLARQQALEELAEDGITDPSHIAARLRTIRGERPPGAVPDSHFNELIEKAAGADERLMVAGTGTTLHILELPEDLPDAEDAEAPEEEQEARPAA